MFGYLPGFPSAHRSCLRRLLWCRIPRIAGRRPRPTDRGLPQRCDRTYSLRSSHMGHRSLAALPLWRGSARPPRDGA